jgi:hypothetical protein
MRRCSTCLFLFLSWSLAFSRIAEAQGSSSTPTTPVLPTTASTKKTKKEVDPRYAVGRGSWSAATISLFNTWTTFDRNPGRHMSFYSPDHKKLVEVIESDVTLRINGKVYETNIGAKHDAELGWAPDSSKFFVTWTETGELGPWHTQVYAADDGGIREIPDVGEIARKDFERRVRRLPISKEFDNPEGRAYWEGEEYCEPYHVIGARWLNGSKELLLSVLVVNVGNCRYASEFNVYRVNAETGEILQRYTAREAHKTFGEKYLPLITTDE